MKRIKKRYTANQLNISLVLWIIGFSTLLCGAGITFGILKNEQVKVVREIKQLESEINSCRMTEEFYRSKKISLTSHWAIKAKLTDGNSVLQPIENEQLQIIDTHQTPRAVASN